MTHRQRSRLALSIARPYIRRRLGRAFDGVFVEGLEAMRNLSAREPVLVAANHVCWWDALTILALDEPLAIESHCLMDAANLQRMPFFGWMGALPLDRSSARASITDLKRAAAGLAEPGQALWIFPQGEQRPAHRRPLDFSRGVEWLARKTSARVVPLALNYLFRETSRPTAVATFGAPLAPPTKADGGAWLTTLESRVSEGLQRCDDFVMSGAGSFEALVAPPPTHGVPLAGRFLAAAMGGRQEA